MDAARADAAVREEGMTIATIEEIQEMGAWMKAILGLFALARHECNQVQ